MVKTISKTARTIVPILGISLDSTRKGELLNAVIGYVLEERLCLVVTPNPEIVVRAQKDNTLRKIINQADFSLPDGQGLVWASQGKIRERIAGIDFAEDLVREARKRGWKIFFVGGKSGVAEETAKNLVSRFKIQDSRFQSEAGPWLGEDGRPIDEKQARIEEETVRKIKQFGPDIVFVGFGPPKQEKWIKRNQGKLPTALYMTVGGAFDIWSGKIKRAPGLIRGLGLEWTWRLIQEPWRARRIFTAVIEFPLRVLWHRYAQADRTDPLIDS